MSKPQYLENVSDMDSIQERVERGAKLLDEKRPGWWKKIDLDLLRLSSCFRCVLGQLCSIDERKEYPISWFQALAGILCGNFDVTPIFDFAVPHGFAKHDDENMAVYPALEAAWKTLILSRRAAPEPVVLKAPMLAKVVESCLTIAK